MLGNKRFGYASLFIGWLTRWKKWGSRKLDRLLVQSNKQSCSVFPRYFFHGMLLSFFSLAL